MRLIDVDKLIDYTDDRYSWHEIGRRERDDIVWALEYAPTVDAVPVRYGKWTVTPTYIKCSECGESFMLYPQNYCPNCGARMDVE